MQGIWLREPSHSRTPVPPMCTLPGQRPCIEELNFKAKSTGFVADCGKNFEQAFFSRCGYFSSEATYFLLEKKKDVSKEFSSLVNLLIKWLSSYETFSWKILQALEYLRGKKTQTGITNGKSCQAGSCLFVWLFLSLGGSCWDWVLLSVLTF